MDSDFLESARIIAAGFTIAMGGMGPAIAIGLIGYGAMQAIGRNPEVASKLQASMILLVAFAEAIAIYSLVLSFILRFV